MIRWDQKHYQHPLRSLFILIRNTPPPQKKTQKQNKPHFYFGILENALMNMSSVFAGEFTHLSVITGVVLVK